MNNQSPEKLLNELLESSWDPDKDGIALNNLLEGFYAGFPVENLLFLISSKEEKIVRAGAWIASELGTKVCPVFEHVKSLIRSQDRKVRFYVADCFLLCAQGQEILELIYLLKDREASVRWRAMDCLWRLSHEQIHSGFHWNQYRNNTEFLEGLTILKDNESQKLSVDDIKRLMSSTSFIVQKIGIIVAKKNKLSSNIIQEIASLSKDVDVKNFAGNL